MSTYVHLNDIFDIVNPNVMQMRIDYAFGTDGTEFWENFFLCDDIHENDRVIYLFTEYQLEFLWNWWNNAIKTSKNKEIQVNLDYSQQKLFNTITTQKGKMVDRIHACYINNHEANLKIQRVFFGVSPIFKKKPDKHIDFFGGRFRGKLTGNGLTEDGRRKELLKLVSMRKEIEKIFNSTIKRSEKWLRYLGPQYTDIQCIEYCNGLNSGCHFGGHSF